MLFRSLRRFYPCRDAQKVSFSPFFCYVPANQRMIRITAERMPFGMDSFVEPLPVGMGSFSELVHVGTGSGQPSLCLWHGLGQLSPQNMTLFVPEQGFEIQKVFRNRLPFWCCLLRWMQTPSFISCQERSRLA